MIIDCIGCLHGARPKLEGGDLLIVTGDLTSRDGIEQHSDFIDWLYTLDYKKIIVIAGNHDNILQKNPNFYSKTKIEYLCDSSCEFEDMKIWGSPWSKTFEGMNPNCKAFTVDTEEELEEKFSLIPDDVDILITHTTPHGILDGIPMEDGSKFHVGSKSLQMQLFDRIKPKLIVFSHVHEGYGEELPGGIVEKAVNCSIMDGSYRPVNKPIRVIL